MEQAQNKQPMIEMPDSNHHPGERADLAAVPADSGYDIDYSSEHGLPRVRVPRNDGSVQEGWFAVGETTGPDGGEFYKTAYGEPVLIDGEWKYLSKAVPKAVLEELNSGLVERIRLTAPEDVGATAMSAAGIEQPMPPVAQEAQVAPESDPSKLREREIVDKLAEMMAGLSSEDKGALHFYATAIYVHELNAARDKMSDSLKSNHDLIIKTKDLYDELKMIRAAR